MKRRDLIVGSAALVGSAVLSRCGGSGRAGNGLSLLEPGKIAQVVAEPEDMVAAKNFVAGFEDLTGERLEITDQPAADNRPLVLIGNVRTNARLRDLAGPERVEKLTSQGILLATVDDGTRPVLLVAGGSQHATPGAVGELLNFHLDAMPNRASVPPLDWIDNPALAYRIFWNWDHSTNWARGAAGKQEVGCYNPYLKKEDIFLTDFRKVLDYSAEHKINGLIIWGFLRDSHGGVEHSRQLVDYAYERGIRVLPGIGTSFYGGIYYEGNHPYNVKTWLAQNPSELRFLDKEGKRRSDAICCSKVQNQNWLREGAAWLFSEFPRLGGANLENGDFFTCETDDCKRARQRSENDPNYYWDMTVTQLPIIEAAWASNPNLWMTYATYTGFSPEEIWKNTEKSLVRSDIPRFVSQFPEDAICQWTLTHMVEGWGQEPEGKVREKWPAGLQPPTEHSIGLLHQGSQWYPARQWWTRSSRGTSAGQRYVEISELIRYTCLRCEQEGLEGLEILGEVDEASPANELNYLAFEEFTWHPQKTMDDFIDDRLARIYGSAEDARRYVRMVQSEEQSLQALMRDLGSAVEASDHRQFNARQRRRWSNLRAELARRISLLE